jgi:hypothetical protein
MKAMEQISIARLTVANREKVWKRLRVANRKEIRELPNLEMMMTMMELPPRVANRQKIMERGHLLMIEAIVGVANCKEMIRAMIAMG